MTCVGRPSGYSTFEKLVYCGVNLETAHQIQKACDEFRFKGYNDNVIVQCCSKGFIKGDDLNQINESHCGIVKNPAKVRRITATEGMTWDEFVKHLRLDL